jgi:hypothetical protein
MTKARSKMRPGKAEGAPVRGTRYWDGGCGARKITLNRAKAGVDPRNYDIIVKQGLKRRAARHE